MNKIPTENHIRTLMDEVSPTELQPCFDELVNELVQKGGLKAFQSFEDRVCIALDGTEFFCSQKLSCPHCLTRKRSNGNIENYHTLLSATIVAPDHDKALPLMPEFISNQDGMEKQDCERNAVKRWLGKHHGRVKDLKPIYLGDSLLCCQPIANAVLETGCDFIFVCKPGDHKTLYDFIDGATPETVMEKLKDKRGKRLVYRYKWINDVPLRDGKDALKVNWVSIEVTDAKDAIRYKGAFVTNLLVTEANVAQIVSCGRARWKIENESFNVLKNNGYNLEHNYGHGSKYLPCVFATMNFLAFALHTVCDCLDSLWQAARSAKGPRKRFFTHLRTITCYLVFETWQQMLQTLITGRPPPTLQKNCNT